MKFIGIDVHSRRSACIVLGKTGKILNKVTIKTQESDLINFVRSVKGKKKLAFEEGVMSQWLYLLLKDEVEQIIVCQPHRKQGPKTDFIDAAEIADLLRVGRLKSVFHADTELMTLRTLVSGYLKLIQEITRTKNRYNALYRQVAIATDMSNFYTSQDNLVLLPDEPRRFVATSLFEQLALLEAHRQEYVNRFEANAYKYKPVRLLTSIPSIGVIRANLIVGILITPYRFPKKYNLFAYSVLTKHNRTSDGKPYGKSKAQGRVVLKEVFKMAALQAIRADNAFRRKYLEMKEAGCSERAARNAIAKTLAATVLGVWKSGKKYDDTMMEVRRRQSQKCHSGT